MKKQNILSFKSILTVLLLLSFISLNAQTYVDIVNIQCYEPISCPSGIDIKVTRTITNNTTRECGAFDVLVSFEVLTGNDCLERIGRERWYVGLNYSPGNQTSVHISNMGASTIQLSFLVETICGKNTFTFDHQVTTTESCSGCESAVSYCTLADYKSIEVLPKINGIGFLTYTQNGYFTVNSSNNFGIFTFPYYTRIEEDCTNLNPGLHDLINDLNTFLDLARTGNPIYENHTGHVYLMDSYGQPLGNSPGTDLCKIRINFVDCGMMWYDFNNVFFHQFYPASCTWELFAFNQDYPARIYIDQNFPYNASCLTCGGIPCNNLAFGSNIEFFGDIDENDNLNDFNFECYPTICTDKINLEWESKFSEKFSIEVFDISGKIKKNIQILRKKIISRLI